MTWFLDVDETKFLGTGRAGECYWLTYRLDAIRALRVANDLDCADDGPIVWALRHFTYAEALNEARHLASKGIPAEALHARLHLYPQSAFYDDPRQTVLDVDVTP